MSQIVAFFTRGRTTAKPTASSIPEEVTVPAPAKRRRLSDISDNNQYSDDIERVRRGVRGDGTRIIDFNTIAAVLSRRDVATALKALSRTRPQGQRLKEDAALDDFIHTLQSLQANFVALRGFVATCGDVGIDKTSFDACDYNTDDFDAVAEWLISLWHARSIDAATVDLAEK